MMVEVVEESGQDQCLKAQVHFEVKVVVEAENQAVWVEQLIDEVQGPVSPINVPPIKTKED